jgi:hypothetical protein
MKSSVVRAHLQFQLEEIRVQLNKQLGKEYIRQIKLT